VVAGNHLNPPCPAACNRFDSGGFGMAAAGIARAKKVSDAKEAAANRSGAPHQCISERSPDWRVRPL